MPIQKHKETLNTTVRSKGYIWKSYSHEKGPFKFWSPITLWTAHSEIMNIANMCLCTDLNSQTQKLSPILKKSSSRLIRCALVFSSLQFCTKTYQSVQKCTKLYSTPVTHWHSDTQRIQSNSILTQTVPLLPVASLISFIIIT